MMKEVTVREATARVQLKVEETMEKRALPASATEVPNRRRQFEGTIAHYVAKNQKSKKALTQRHRGHRENPRKSFKNNRFFMFFSVFSVSLCTLCLCVNAFMVFVILNCPRA
jgi:hypothetical protein